MTARKKNKVQLIELHWTTDRDKINEILKALNPKYLLGRLEYHDPYNKRANNDHKYTVRINYNGYTFTCSKRTLTKECERRAFKEGTMMCCADYKLWNSPNRFHRFGYLSKKDNNIRFAKSTRVGSI